MNNSNINDYIEKKNDLTQKIENVRSKISKLDKMDVDISDALKKIDSAIKSLQEEKISIVLVGAFSDGKTSVISGWLNDKLVVGTDETTDELQFYKPASIPEGCQIVDTPGLFGDKDGADENGGQIVLSDITKKYISEANLILYVVEAKNPVKNTHKECMKWILRDLNKLSATVFVINKMDDVADLTDDDDYNMQAKIKTDNLRKKLTECGLSESEANKAKVACVSAAPGGEDIKKWSDHYDAYLRRSRLGTLEQMTNDILQDSGKDLIIKTGYDILNNEIGKMINNIEKQEDELSNILIPEEKKNLMQNKKELDDLYNRIIRSRQDMKDELKVLRMKKINKIKAVTIDDYKDILEGEIGLRPGEEGDKLDDEINDIFIKYANQFTSWTHNTSESFIKGYERQDEKTNAMLTKGGTVLADGLKALGRIDVGKFKDVIFAGRDLLKKAGIANIKFKPWQVTKMASNLQNGLPAFGAAIDLFVRIVEDITEKEKQEKFEEFQEKIKEIVESIFDEVNKMLNSEEKYMEEFAPGYKILKDQIVQEEKNIEFQEKILHDFEFWKDDFMSSNIMQVD